MDLDVGFEPVNPLMDHLNSKLLEIKCYNDELEKQVETCQRTLTVYTESKQETKVDIQRITKRRYRNSCILRVYFRNNCDHEMQIKQVLLNWTDSNHSLDYKTYFPLLTNDDTLIPSHRTDNNYGGKVPLGNGCVLIVFPLPTFQEKLQFSIDGIIIVKNTDLDTVLKLPPIQIDGTTLEAPDDLDTFYGIVSKANSYETFYITTTTMYLDQEGKDFKRFLQGFYDMKSLFENDECFLIEEDPMMILRVVHNKKNGFWLVTIYCVENWTVWRFLHDLFRKCNENQYVANRTYEIFHCERDAAMRKDPLTWEQLKYVLKNQFELIVNSGGPDWELNLLEIEEKSDLLAASLKTMNQK